MFIIAAVFVTLVGGENTAGVTNSSATGTTSNQSGNNGCCNTVCNRCCHCDFMLNMCSFIGEARNF